MVERIITCEWRLRRTYRAEAGLIVNGGGVENVFQGMDHEMAALSRYETAIDRALQRARHELERYQARCRGEAVAAPIAITVSGTVDVKDQPRPPRNHPRHADGLQSPLPFTPQTGDIRCADNDPADDGSRTRDQPREVDHNLLRNEPNLACAGEKTPVQSHHAIASR
jgi:hypothetical protein